MNEVNKIFEEIFGGFGTANQTANRTKDYYDKVEYNEYLINNLYTITKETSKYKLFKMKSGDYQIQYNNEYVNSFIDLIEAKYEFIILSMKINENKG